MRTLALVSVLIAQLAAADQVHAGRLDTLIRDMTDAHDARPSGVTDAMGWAAGPRFNMRLAPPSDWSHMTAWGQAYVPTTGSPATNTRIAIRDMRTYYFSQASQTWVVCQGPGAVEGGAYLESFADDASAPADIRTAPGGVTEVLLTPGYNYHFWPASGRFQFPRADLRGWYVCAQARLVVDRADRPDDRASARIMLGVGADYWRDGVVQWVDDWSNNADMAIGRLRFVGTGWGWHHMWVLPTAITDPRAWMTAHPVPTIIDVVPNRRISLVAPRPNTVFEILQPGGSVLGTGLTFDLLPANRAHILRPLPTGVQ
jgi:hypothetical protein